MNLQSVRDSAGNKEVGLSFTAPAAKSTTSKTDGAKAAIDAKINKASVDTLKSSIENSTNDTAKLANHTTTVINASNKPSLMRTKSIQLPLFHGHIDVSEISKNTLLNTTLSKVNQIGLDTEKLLLDINQSLKNQKGIDSKLIQEKNNLQTTYKELKNCLLSLPQESKLEVNNLEDLVNKYKEWDSAKFSEDKFQTDKSPKTTVLKLKKKTTETKSDTPKMTKGESLPSVTPTWLKKTIKDINTLTKNLATMKGSLAIIEAICVHEKKTQFQSVDQNDQNDVNTIMKYLESKKNINSKLDELKKNLTSELENVGNKSPLDNKMNELKGFYNQIPPVRNDKLIKEMAQILLGNANKKTLSQFKSNLKENYELDTKTNLLKLEITLTEARKLGTNSYEKDLSSEEKKKISDQIKEFERTKDPAKISTNALMGIYDASVIERKIDADLNKFVEEAIEKKAKARS